ncbi:MAG: ABC transporter substrate-binding protein [Eubacteriales bacterium]|nr:ABC transporter substrate-binding protein [Eubacteriales bacterium]
MLKKMWAALMLCALLLCAPAFARELEITDMFGDVAVLEGPAERIVVLTAGECEILYAIGAQEAIVGRGEYCNYPPEALEIPAVQSGFETNIEQIIALEPQVVLTSSMNQTLEQIEQLKAAGIAVIQTQTGSIEDVYAAIRMIGQVTGKNAEAEALVASMQGEFAELAQLAAQQEPLTIYYEISPLEWGLWTGGEQTFMHEIGALLGLQNIFGELTGWAEVSAEQVISRDPQVVITTMMPFSEEYTPVEEILGRTGWQGVRAIRDGRVYATDSDSFTRPGPRLALAARELYEAIWGTAE